MLIDALYRPIPPSDLVARLEKVDSRLGLRWVQQGEARGGGLWAITYGWSPTDRRWEGVQRGDWDKEDANDVLVFLPSDCPVDDAYGYFVNHVRRSNNDDVHRMLGRLGLANTEQKDENWKPVMDEAFEKIEGNAGRLFESSTGQSVPRSFGGIETKRKAVKKKATKGRKKAG